MAHPGPAGENTRGRKLHLIVNGHPAHRSRKAVRWREERTHLIKVHFLPGDNPEINSAEHLNNDTKHTVLASQRRADTNKLVGAARTHLHLCQKQSAVIASFFRHPDIAYAAKYQV